MPTSPAVSRLRELHDKAKHFALPPGEQAIYERACRDLASAILAAQQRQRLPGQTARRSLRVAQALKVEVELPNGPHATLTLDVSTEGFAALVPDAPEDGQIVHFVLHARPEPVEGEAVIVGSRRQHGAYRASFAIAAMHERASELLRVVVVDATLQRLNA
jgi:hypothetical protein